MPKIYRFIISAGTPSSSSTSHQSTTTTNSLNSTPKAVLIRIPDVPFEAYQEFAVPANFSPENSADSRAIFLDFRRQIAACFCLSSADSITAILTETERKVILGEI